MSTGGTSAALHATSSAERNAPGACNDGFLRDDALLVIVLITDEEDEEDRDPFFGCDGGTPADPAQWYTRLVTNKFNIESNIVMLSLSGLPGSSCADHAGRINQFGSMFTNHAEGEICAGNYAEFFTETISQIDTACQDFAPRDEPCGIIPRMRRTAFSILCLALAGCAASPRPATVAPQSEPPAPEAAPEPTPEPFEPPCVKEGECLDRVVSKKKLTIYGTANATTPLVTEQPTATFIMISEPRLANPGRAEDERAQLICSNDTLTAQVFVDQADLQQVTNTFVIATPQQEARADGVGVSLVPGVPVTIEEAGTNSTRVSFDKEAVRGTGWVSPDSVAWSYRRAETDPRTLPSEGRTNLGFVQLELAESPGGPSFATLDGSVIVQPLGKKKRGHTLVAASGWLKNRTYAVGWLPTKKIKPPKGGVPSGIYGAIRKPQDVLEVPAGAQLVDPNGNVVAVMHQAAELACTDDCKGAEPELTVTCLAEFPTRLRPQ